MEVLRTGAEAHADHIRKRLEKVLATIHLSGHRPLWVHGYVAKKRLKGLNDTTVLRYLEDLQCFELDPAGMTLEEVEKRLALLSRMIKKASYRRTVITIKQALYHLGRGDEADEIPLPKKPEPRIALLTKEELGKLLEGCTNVRDRLLIQFMTEMGSRRGEIAALRIKDIAFDQYSSVVWLRGKTGRGDAGSTSANPTCYGILRTIRRGAIRTRPSGSPDETRGPCSTKASTRSSAS